MPPLSVHSWLEAHLYLQVTPCQDCSKGPWQIQSEPQDPRGRTLRARCLHCHAEKEFTFECSPAGVGEGAGASASEQSPELREELINPSPAPSRVVDVGQWLSLFYLLVETASKAADKAETRRLTFRAAQCLDEALKFYTADDELPPASALFTEPSGQAFAEHPERFARQRLRDLRGKLPDLRVMARRLARDAQKAGRRRWWQFWRG